LADLRRLHGALTLLGTVDGAATREKLAHLIFADVRLDGEFFQVTPAITAFMDKYGTPPPPAPTKVETVAGTDGGFIKTSGDRPWVDLYGDPMVAHDRDEFARDYENWIARGLVSPQKRELMVVFRSFPERIVFVPQPGLHGWGWTPLNPRCWTDESGRWLYVGDPAV
jgi:hypothetical protein